MISLDESEYRKKIQNEIKSIETYIYEMCIDEKELINDVEVIKNYDMNLINVSLFQIEKKILRLWEKLREYWINEASKTTYYIYKSPKLGNLIKLKSGTVLNYSYERNIQCDFLERKCKEFREIKTNWNQDHVLFSSGMAALTTLINCYRSMLKNRINENIRIIIFGDYYETRTFFEFFRNKEISIIYAKDEDELIYEIEKDFDILFIEPVKYNWDLEVLQMDILFKSITSLYEKKYRMIIFDSTLVSQNIPIDSILNNLVDTEFLLIIDFCSLLKLNQEGFELSNAGLLSIYTSNNYYNDGINAVAIASYIRKIRTILGTGLCLREIALLDNFFSFNKKRVKLYSDQVFLNNAMLANALEKGKLFNKISHPSIGLMNNLNWAKSPFVVLRLYEKDDNYYNYGMLLSIVKFEAEKRNLELYMGSSFGFRHCRFEVIIPDLKLRRGIFKIAMGQLNGINRDRIIELFIELSNYDNIDILFNKYKFLEPIDLEDLE